jgi:hypothetical protein
MIKKGTAFLMCFIAFCSIFVAMFILGIVKKDFSIIPVTTAFSALGMLTGGYIGLRIGDNISQGLTWNNDKFNAENAIDSKESTEK